MKWKVLRKLESYYLFFPVTATILEKFPIVLRLMYPPSCGNLLSLKLNSLNVFSTPVLVLC